MADTKQIRKVLKAGAIAVGSGAAALALLAAGVRSASAQADFTHVVDVEYGRRGDTPLKMDVLKPAHPTGIGVIFLMSGGWASNRDAIGDGSNWHAFPQLGQTVFLVMHRSRPQFKMPDIVSDVRRAVRYVRAHAAEYEVDPDRIAIAGMSSGGHLSALIATIPEAGDPAAADPVDRVSSRVGAAACFCPPLDFVEFGSPGHTVLEHPSVGPAIRELLDLNGKSPAEQAKMLAAWSPLRHVTRETPPILVLQGDKDEIVPHEQADRFMAKLEENGVPHGLVMRPGQGHGWDDSGRALLLFAAWFASWLPGK